MELYEPGKLHHGLTYEQYAECPGLRSSDLKNLMKTPAHFKAAQEAKEEEKSDALEFGSLFHSALENGERFLSTYKIEPTFVGKTKDGRDSERSAEAKVLKQMWYNEQAPGTIIVKQRHVEPLLGMINACMKHKRVSHLLKDGVRETSLWVEDPKTGVMLKCRPDFISSKNFMVDIKSTRNAHHSFFTRQIFSSRNDGDPFYALQAAHYAYCAKVAGLNSGDAFIFIAVEKEPPYGIVIYPMDVGCLGPGEQWRSHLTDLYAQCLASGKWPSYPEEAFPLVPPEWVDLPGKEEGN